MTSLAALPLLLLTVSPTADERAAAVEEVAFKAADDKRFCDALALFLEANTIAPNPDLVFNAAQVAEAAGDHQRAIDLYFGLLSSSPTPERRAEVRARIEAVTNKIESEGAGTKCVAPPPAAPPPNPTTSTTTTTAQSAPAEPKPAVKSTSATAVTPAASDVAAPAPSGSVVPWIVGGVGGAVIVGGAVVALVGSEPYRRHGALAATLASVEQDAQRGGVSTEEQRAVARDLHGSIEIAAADWSAWGQLTTTIGVMAIASGAAALTAGAVLVMME